MGGGFNVIWGGDEGMFVGNAFTQCSSAAYEEARRANNELNGMPSSNYGDLQLFLDTAPEEILSSLDLFPGDGVEYLIEIWGGDAYTQENFMVNIQCVEDLANGA